MDGEVQQERNMTLIEKEWKAKNRFIGKHIRLYRDEYDKDQKFFLCMDIRCSGAPSGWFCNYIFYDDNYEQVLMWAKIRDIQIHEFDMSKNERCPRCKLKEMIDKKKDPEYLANDYLNILVFIPVDPTSDHNRKCWACGLIFRIDKNTNQRIKK